MNNTEPLIIKQDPNMLDDVVRFYESQIAEDEQDGIRSPFLSTFTIDEYWAKSGSSETGGPFPRYTSLVDSYGSVNLEPDRTTQRTTAGLWDGYKQVKGYRALKTGRYIVEGNVNVGGNDNGVFGLRLMGFNGLGIDGTRTIQAPRQQAIFPLFRRVEESQYRTCIYMTTGQYFIMQLYMNAYEPRNVSINGRLKVFCIEDKFTIGQTLS